MTDHYSGVARARAALPVAQRQRAEYLVALTEGLITPVDLIDAAALDSGRPLRRIQLRQVLLAQEGWGEARTGRFLSVVADRLGLPPGRVADRTVAWLIDPRSGGRRYLAWLDAQRPKQDAPWPGFPFTPAAAAA